MWSKQEAHDFLRAYASANPDLPPQTRDTLALCILARRCSKATLRALTGGDLGQFYTGSRGFLYWNALSLSGLGGEWERVQREHNEGRRRPGAILAGVRARVEREQWELLCARLGHWDDNPARTLGVGHHSGRRIWTKGGDWDRGSNLTQLLVLKRHIGQRRMWRPLHRRLGQAGVRQIERELMLLVDPDHMLGPEAKRFAHDYTRRRVAELVGGMGGMRIMGPEHLPWFWKQSVIYGGKMYSYTPGYRRIPRRTRKHGDWLTEELL